MKIIKARFEILTSIHDTEILSNIEIAGRTCYKSEDKITLYSASNFVKNIIERGHESVLEHQSISVRVICDRGVSHEIVRHRIAAYSQESTRYCNYSGGVTFIAPCFLVSVPTGDYDLHSINKGRSEDAWHVKTAAWLEAMSIAEHIYLRMLNLGMTPQEARSVLPNSTKTEIVMTMNLREWRHFFKLRTAVAAHPQMREIAIPMLNEFKRLIPVVFDDIEA